MSLSKLKIISIILFSIITRNNNEHVIFPMIVILVISVFYVILEFRETILSSAALIGIFLILLSNLKIGKYITFIGYVLTYPILLNSFFDQTFYSNLSQEIYFISTSFLYILLSLFIMLKQYRKL
jgi:hypothetical protein